MSEFKFIHELKPSPELVALFAPLITAIMPKNPVAQTPVQPPVASIPQQASPLPTQQPPRPQYQTPINPTPAPQQYIPATPAMPAAPATHVPTPYPSNPAIVNPTYASQHGAPVAPVTTYTAPTATPGNPAPTAAVPSFTYDDLARAGSTLMDIGKNPNVLFSQFGIQALQELPKERYGEFATALRQMGARI